LRAGNVRAAFATIFVQQRTPAESGPWTFSSEEEAYHASVRQIEIYLAWAQRGLVAFNNENPSSRKPLDVTLLMEGCSGLRTVDDFQWFYERNVRIVALTWAEGNKWSGGDRTLTDVTPEGKKLLAEIDRLHCIHDVSHLSERGFWTVMAETKQRKIASHSNCRALLPEKQYPERNLSDAQIRALVEQNGIIGINLFNPFLVSGPTAPPRAAIADVLRHIAHMEQLTGRRDFLALGTDFDGGYGRTSWPIHLDGPELLHHLADALSAANWSDAEIHRFAWQNWADLLAALPSTPPAE
jgi:membrane dipeptidase